MFHPVGGDTSRMLNRAPGLFAVLAWCPLWLLSSAPAARAQTPHLDAQRFKNLGVAYLEENRPADAERAFRRVTQLAPDEALGYANLGITYLRLGQLPMAASQLEQARRVDPANAQVLLLGAEVQFSAGRWEAVIATARKVLETDPGNAIARYYIYRSAMAQGDDELAKRAAAEQIDQLFHDHPHNLVICLRFARAQAIAGQWQTVRQVLDSIAAVVQEVRQAEPVLEAARTAVADRNREAARKTLTILENVLRPTTRFRQDLSQLQPPVAGLPLQRFSDTFYRAFDLERPPAIDVVFQHVSSRLLPASPVVVSHVMQAGIDFADVDGDGRDDWLVGYTDGTSGSVQLWQYEDGVWSNALRTWNSLPASQLRFVDFDSDGQLEAVVIGPSGLVILQRGDDAQWHAITAPAEAVAAPGNALELIDADNEGDLDLCVAARTEFRLWQNRGDLTLRDISPRSGLSVAGGNVRQVVATDHDDDLDMDLVIVGSAGQLELFDNRRHGQFAREACGLFDVACTHVMTRDFDNDGWEDLLLIADDGRLCMQRNNEGTYAPAVEIPIPGLMATTAADLDLDNDGWLDVAVAGRRQDQTALVMLRNAGDGTWTATDLKCPPAACAALGATDLDRDGDLDLVAIDERGTIQVWRNDGGNANHWLRVELRGLRSCRIEEQLAWDRQQDRSEGRPVLRDADCAAARHSLWIGFAWAGRPAARRVEQRRAAESLSADGQPDDS